MSNVALDPPNLNGHSASSAGAAPESSSFDIVQILWRWKWLPILGAVVGGCLGFLYYSRQAYTYEAAALVQIVNSVPAPVRNPIYDPRDGGITRVDESMVIRSQAVLNRAVKLGRLTEQLEFVGLSAEAVVALLKSPKSTLVIEPADKDDQTTMIKIAYVSESKEVAAKVVHAIVDGYEAYLADEYKTVGDEIATVIEKAHGELAERVKELNRDAATFRESNPDIMWFGGEPKDPYADTFLGLHAKVNQLRTQRTELESVSLQARQSLASGEEPDAIFHLLAQFGSKFGDTASPYAKDVLGVDGPDVGMRIDTQSKRLELEKLLPLRIKLRVISEDLGESHPQVSATRKEVELLEKQVSLMMQAELEYEAEDKRLREAFAKETGAEIKSMDERLASRLDALDGQIAVLERQEVELDKQAAQQQVMSRELQGMLDTHRVMIADTDAVNTLLAVYTEKLQQIDLMPKMGQRVLKRLDMPREGWFFGPTVPKYLLGGGAVGFILLSGLAVLMDLADRSYRNPSEIATDLNVTVLGHIPVMNLAKVKKSVESVDPAVCAIHHSKGRVAEAYRAVRTGLFFSNKGKALKVLQITSPVPGDGKSTLASNIAVTMAQSGRRVLLIDADLRRPRIAKVFGIDSEVGVAAVVNGQVEIDEAICAGPVANLFILPGGKRPSNPAEILSSERFANMIDMLRDKFDMIVIDTPPLLAVSDPGAVAGIVDGVLMTMRLRRNVKPLAARAKSIIDSVGANLLGVVINGVSSEAGYGYNYDYNDYRYAYKHGSNYRSGYGYRYGYGNYRYGYSEESDSGDLSTRASDA